MTNTPPNTKPDDSWLKSRNLPRLAFSVALAPPVAGALLALILSVTVFNGRIFLVPGPEAGQFVGADLGEIATNLFMAITNGFILGALIGWPVMLVVGLPLHAFLLRKTSASMWVYVLAGIVAGLAGGAARVMSSSAVAVSTAELTQALAIGAVTGTLAAFIFWYVRRPDRDAAEYKT